MAISYSIQEIGSINLTPIFNKDHKNTSFSYTLGLGIDKKINEHLRLGLAYRFVYLGKASLGNGYAILILTATQRHYVVSTLFMFTRIN